MGAGKVVGRPIVSAALALIAAFLLSVIVAPQAQSQTAQAEFKWQDLGARVFDANCGPCHQQNGQGVPGAFPPLAGHVAESFAQREGRDYLLRLVLFGLEGTIVVKGNTFESAMPPWAQLSDSEIAAALDHVLTAWGNDKLLGTFTPILPADVAAARAQQMTAADVLALRHKILAPAPGGAASAAPAALSFTAEQAERGEAAYQRNCQDCHGSTLDNGEFGGKPLNGSYFRRSFSDGNVAGLLGKTRTMPPDRPGQLSDQTYVDLAAFLLRQNGYAPGATELPADLEAQRRMSLKK